jgi:hypothetical protein
MVMSNEADLLALFKKKRLEIGTAALAESIGVSNVTVRSIDTGHYRGKPDAVLAAFAERWVDVVLCPYIDEVINREDCKNRHTAPKPFGGKAKQAWWETCQTCVHNVQR